MMELCLNGVCYELRRLRAEGLLGCIRAAEELAPRLETPGCEPSELACALAEHGALAAACLYREGQPAFGRAEDALRELTVEELCRVYECYAEQTEVTLESGRNENFPKEDGHGTV